MSAMKSGMSRNTARKHLRQKDVMEQRHKPHDWRTRKDPLEAIWPQAEEMLRQAPELEAKALFEHLASGREETAGTDTYTWDFENRLTALSVAGTGSYAYTYDYRTRRIVRDESAAAGVETQLTFSGGVSVQEATPAGVVQVELLRGSDWGGGVGGILYTIRGTDFSFNAYNSRGDVVSTSDSSGAATWQAAYEAFGTRTAEDGSNAERQRANTKDEDPTGLLNEGFRYRDLEAGVFISRDPLGFVDGPNVYTYVAQNPWTFFDPLGLQERKISGVVQKEIQENSPRGGFIDEMKMDGGTIIAHPDDKLFDQVPEGVSKEQALRKIVGESGRVIFAKNQNDVIKQLSAMENLDKNKPIIIYDHGMQYPSERGGGISSVGLQLAHEDLEIDSAAMKLITSKTNSVIFGNCAAAAEGSTNIHKLPVGPPTPTDYAPGNREKFVKMAQIYPHLTTYAATDYVWSNSYVYGPAGNKVLGEYSLRTGNKTWVRTRMEAITSAEYQALGTDPKVQSQAQKIFERTRK